MNDQKIDNYLLIRVLQDTDINLAIEAISNPDLNQNELSDILDAHFSGRYKHKETGEVLLLDSKVVMAGLRNSLFNYAKSKAE